MALSDTLRSCAERLALRPGDPEAVAVLEGLLTTPDRFEAARFLLPVYERSADNAALLRTLEVLAGSDQRPEQLKSLKRIAALYRELRQPDLTLPAAAKAIALDATDASLYRLAEGAAVEAEAVDVLVELLTDVLEGLSGPARASLHKALAGLCERHLKDGAGAAKHLRAALELNPGDLEPIEPLRRWHAQREEWSALAELDETLAQATTDPKEKLNAWREAAKLHETKIHDDQSALECWLQVLDLSPVDSWALDAVRGLAIALDRPPLIAQTLERAHAAAAGPQKPAVAVQLAEHLKAQGDTERAATLCREVLAGPVTPASERAKTLLDELFPPANPTERLLATLSVFRLAKDRPAMLPELRRLAEEADAREEVAEAVEGESETVESPEELAALLRFVALLREELDQPRKATVLWNDLLAAQPHDAEALEHLARLLAGAKEPSNAAEVSLRRGRLARPGPERHARFVEAADFFVAAGNAEQALSALDESLSRVAPAEAIDAVAAVQLRRGRLLEARGDARAVEAYAAAMQMPALGEEASQGLTRLLQKPATRAAAAGALEPFSRAAGAPKLRADILEAQEGGTGDERAARAMEIAVLREQAGEGRLALAALLRAFALAPKDERLRAALERLADTLNAKDELLAAYEELFERTPQAGDTALLRRIAELHDALGNRDAAFEAWEHAAEAAPQDVELLRAYADKCRSRGDLRRLARVLRWQIAATPDEPSRLKLLATLANLYDDSLADYAAAAQAYRELLDRSPDDRGLLKTLERLYIATNDRPGLSMVLERALSQARQSGQPEVVGFALRLAKLLLEPPLRGEQALALLDEVLRLEPSNAQAVAALAQLASTPGPAQSQAAKRVEGALDTLGDYGVVVQILEAQLPTESGAHERAAILHRVAELQAGPLKDPELAFLAITRALREAPADASLLQRCIELGAVAGAADELDALLEDLAAAQPPGAVRASLYRALARRFDERGEAEAASAAWSQVFTHAPTDANAQQRLVDLYERDKRYAELAAHWQKRAEAASPAERPTALLALAQAQEKGKDLEASSSTLLTLFALTQGADALAALERVLGLLGRHHERAEALRKLAALTADPVRRLGHLVHQAHALLTAGQPEQAVGVLGEVLTAAPSDSRAVAELVPLLSNPAAKERAAELLETVFRGPEEVRQRLSVLEAMLETPGLLRERALRTELAAVHEQLNNVTQAFATRSRLVNEQPGDAQAREALERLAGQAHLEEELVAAYEDLLDRTADHAISLALREKVARLYGGALQRPDLAAHVWEKIAQGDRTALPPLVELAALYKAAGDWLRLGAVLSRQVPLLTTPEARAPVLRELAQLADGPLHDKALAVDTYRKLLEHVPSDRQALQALGRLLEGTSRGSEAVQLLERELEVEHDVSAKATLELRLGRLVLSTGGAPAAALDWLARALEHRWPDAEAVSELEGLMGRAADLKPRVAEVLERVYREKKDSARLAEALELQVSAAAAPRQLALLEELAVLREASGDLARAFTARNDVFTRSPEDPHTRAELERLAEATGQPDALVAIFRRRLGERPPDAEAVELWRRVAQVSERLGRSGPAAEAWEEVARLSPTDAAPLVTLCRLYLAQQRFDPLPRLLKARAGLASESAEQIALWLELGGIADERLNDAPQAVEAYRAALDHGERAALPHLERLLEKTGRFDELCALLEWRVQQPQDAADQLELTARLAGLEHRSRGRDDAALKLLQAVLERDPHHAAAIAVLEQMLQSERPAAAQAALALESHYADNPALQVEALEVRVAFAPVHERPALLHRIADLHARLLDQLDEAFQALARLLRDSPDDGPALVRALELGAGKRELAALLSEVAPRASKVETQRAMLLPLARLRETLSEPQAALEAWQGLLALEPQHLEALKAASALLEAAARWPEQLELLERRLKLARADDERSALLERIGMLRDDSLADAPGAHETFRQLLALRPDDAHALERLDRLCERLGRWEELNEILSRRLRLPKVDRPQLMLRLAQVRRTRLNDANGALPLLNELLSSGSTDAAAVAELEALVADQPGWENATDLLLDVYRRTRDFAKLAALLDTAATHAPDPARRKALWLELAEVRLTHDDDPELAFLSLAKAYRETPVDAPLRERLIALADKAGAHEALAALFEEVMGTLEAREGAEVALCLAALTFGPLQEPERALSLYRQAMELDASRAPRALRGLDAVLEKLQRWDALLPVLEERENAAGDGPERIALLLRIGAVCAERLEKIDRAVAAYRAVLQRDAEHLGAARALEQLYERSGQSGPQLEILERLVGLVPPGERQATRLKLARLSLESDPDRSVALCRDMLGDDPLHAEAFALLSSQLESTGRLTELDALLKARLKVTLAPKDAAALELRLGELHWRALKDPVEAAVHYCAVLERLPKHEPALVSLAEIYEATGQKRELAHTLSELTQVHPDVERKRAHHVRRAEVLADLADGPGAVAAGRAALELRPETEVELERLRAVLIDQAAWAEAARALGLAIALRLAAGNATRAVEGLFELHNVEGRRNNDDGQAAALEKILSVEPSNRTAYDFGRALYSGTHHWSAWAALTARFLPHLADAEHLSTLDALADVHAQKLRDSGGAFGFALEAIKRDCGSAPRRDTAERLARTLKRIEPVAEVYRSALESMPFGAAFSAVSLALAALEDEHLNQVAAAERTLNRLLERDPTHLPALLALAKMYERRGLHAKRAATLELLLQATADAAARATLFDELAALYEGRLKDPKAAASALGRRLDEAPTPEHGRPLAELHRRHQQWPELGAALHRLASLHRVPKERAAVQLEIAALYEQQLRDPEAAIAAYGHALETEPSNATAFRGLEKLYGTLQRPNELLRAFDHRVANTEDADEKIELHFKSAALHEQRGNPLQADRSLEAVVRLRATDVKALEGLERLRRSGGRWRPLVDALTWHVAAVQQPAALAALCTELGEVHLIGLHDGKAAAQWWQRALEHAPNHRPALHALGALHEQEARWGDAVRCYEREALLEPDARQRAELEHRLGVLCEERLKHETKARGAYGRALAADPVHLGALRRLRALLFKAQQWPEYEENVAVEANGAPTAGERSAAALELARHYEQRAKDRASAIIWYGYAFAQRPEALEAALPLADLLLGDEVYDRAVEVLGAAVQRLDGAELVKRLCQLANAQRQLGQTREALETYGRVLHKDPVEPTALRGQIDLLDAEGHAAQAASKLELFLDHHEAHLKPAERADLRVRLGELFWGLDDAAQADRAAEGALAAVAAHAGALRLAIKACDERAAFERSASYRQRLAAVAPDDERYRLFVELGTLCLEKLGSATRAIDALVKAQTLKPDSKEVLEKLLAAYKAAGHNRAAAELQEQLLAHPALTAAERRTHTLALADLVGRAMGDTERAVQLLERSLDKTPEFVEALQAIEAILGRGKQWPKLDLVYQQMIRRLGDRADTAEQRATLWRSLGELRARRIKDQKSALAAYEEGAKLLPQDPAAQEALAEALMDLPERGKDALAAWLRALPRTPKPQKACLAAATLAEREREPDAAYLALRAAQQLTDGPVDAKLLEKLQAQVPPRFRGVLSERAWRESLLHPSLRGPLGELMALVSEAWAAKHAPDPGDFKLSPKKHAVDFSSRTHASLAHLSHVAQMLGFSSMGLLSPYLAPQSSSKRTPHPDDGVCIKVLPTNPMSIVVGERFVVERDAATLYAEMGFHLVQLRPEVAVTLQVPAEELELVLESALALGDASYVSAKDARLLKGPRKKLEKALSDNGRLALGHVVARYRKVAKPNDFARYLEGARLTSLRGAALVCGDFAPVNARFKPDAQGVRELLRFALDGELHALRLETGAVAKASG